MVYRQVVELLGKSRTKGLDTRHIATKDLSLDPVHEHQDPVAGAEAHAKVSTAPEEVGDGTARGNVTREPRDICDSLLGANVGERTLVGVLEGVDTPQPPLPLLQFLDLLESLVTGLSVGSLLLNFRELRELSIDLLGLGHLVEHAGKESTLLSGDLGGGGVVGDSAVTDSPYVLGTLDNKVLVDSETTAGVLLTRNLVDQILEQRS